MKFDMTRPCDQCPFRRDCLPEWLGSPRAKQIADSLVGGQSFPCHKTTEADGEGGQNVTENSQHCAGALILLERIDRPNQMMRIMERLRLYFRDKLDMTANVFDTFAEFVKHHKRKRKPK